MNAISATTFRSNLFTIINNYEKNPVEIRHKNKSFMLIPTIDYIRYRMIINSKNSAQSTQEEIKAYRDEGRKY